VNATKACSSGRLLRGDKSATRIDWKSGQWIMLGAFFYLALIEPVVNARRFYRRPHLDATHFSWPIWLFVGGYCRADTHLQRPNKPRAPGEEAHSRPRALSLLKDSVV
jgi:hypothetical protein